MQKVDLSNFLELTNVGTIMLPIGEHKFELSQQAAENIVISLQGVLRLLTQRAADGAWDCPKCKKPNIAVASKCWFCEAPRR